MDNYEAAQMQGALDRMRARAQRAEDNANDLRAKLAEAYRALVDAEDKNLWDVDMQIKAREFCEAKNKEKSDD